MSFLVLLCANGVQSALTVASSVTASLSSINVFFVVILGLHLLFCAQEWRNNYVRHGNPFSSWPSHAHVPFIYEHGPEVFSWVASIKRTKAILHKSLISATVTQPHEDLMAVQQELKQHHERAVTMNHPLAVSTAM